MQPVVMLIGIATIARELSLSRSTAKRAIEDLEHDGWLTKEQRWREKGGKSSTAPPICGS